MTFLCLHHISEDVGCVNFSCYGTDLVPRPDLAARLTSP